MQSKSCKMPGWMNHRLESGLPGEITSDMQMTPHLWWKQRGSKEPLDEGERGEWKSWRKTQHSKNEDHGIQSHHFVANRREKVEAVIDFIFLGSKITVDSDCSHEIKRCLVLGRKVMTNLDSVFKNRDITVLTKVCIVKPMVFSSHVRMRELDYKRRLSAKELMLLNCGAGEGSWESLGQWGDETSQS